MKWNQLKKLISDSKVAWILFFVFFLMDWKSALVCYLIPLFILWIVWKEKRRSDWELVLTPITNLYVLYEVIWGCLQKKWWEVVERVDCVDRKVGVSLEYFIGYPLFRFRKCLYISNHSVPDSTRLEDAVVYLLS